MSDQGYAEHVTRLHAVDARPIPFDEHHRTGHFTRNLSPEGVLFTCTVCKKDDWPSQRAAEACCIESD